MINDSAQFLSSGTFVSLFQSDKSLDWCFAPSVRLHPLLAAAPQCSSLRCQTAQLPRLNQVSLLSNSSSSLMLVAATKVFLLFTVTSRTIPYSSGTWLYSSCKYRGQIFLPNSSAFRTSSYLRICLVLFGFYLKFLWVELRLMSLFPSMCSSVKALVCSIS